MASVNATVRHGHRPDHPRKEETAARVATVRASREVRPSLVAVLVSVRQVRRQLDPALNVQRSRSMLARSARPDALIAIYAYGETVRGKPSVLSGVRPWNGRAREGFLRGRHVRSTCRRSVRPAIHVPSRGSPRSSSTGEPSDPPFGALHSELNASGDASRRNFQASYDR